MLPLETSATRGETQVISSDLCHPENIYCMPLSRHILYVALVYALFSSFRSAHDDMCSIGTPGSLLGKIYGDGANLSCQLQFSLLFRFTFFASIMKCSLCYSRNFAVSLSFSSPFFRLTYADLYVILKDLLLLLGYWFKKGFLRVWGCMIWKSFCLLMFFWNASASLWQKIWIFYNLYFRLCILRATATLILLFCISAMWLHDDLQTSTFSLQSPPYFYAFWVIFFSVFCDRVVHHAQKWGKRNTRSSDAKANIWKIVCTNDEAAIRSTSCWPKHR